MIYRLDWSDFKAFIKSEAIDGAMLPGSTQKGALSDGKGQAAIWQTRLIKFLYQLLTNTSGVHVCARVCTKGVSPPTGWKPSALGQSSRGFWEKEEKTSREIKLDFSHISELNILSMEEEVLFDLLINLPFFSKSNFLLLPILLPYFKFPLSLKP